MISAPLYNDVSTISQSCSSPWSNHVPAPQYFNMTTLTAEHHLHPPYQHRDSTVSVPWSNHANTKPSIMLASWSNHINNITESWSSGRHGMAISSTHELSSLSLISARSKYSFSVSSHTHTHTHTHVLIHGRSIYKCIYLSTYPEFCWLESPDNLWCWWRDTAIKVDPVW